LFGRRARAERNVFRALPACAHVMASAQPGPEAEGLDAALDLACDLARRSGAEHWEVRAEALREHGFEYDGAQVRNARTHLALGVGFRVLQERL
jgi:hypothetical protein